MITALLLAAGKATRLGALRDQYAKACVPIAGTHPLRFAIEQLSAAGVQRIVINLHWKAKQVETEARAAAPTHVQLDFLHEEVLLGTGGTLLAYLDQWAALPDLVMNAKQFSDLPCESVLQAPIGSLVLHHGSSLNTFGGLAYSAANQLVGLVRHKAPANLPAGAVDAAVYTGICRPDPAWIPHLKAGAAQARAKQETLCLARSGFLSAAADGIAVPVYLHNGVWCEISTPDRVQEAESIVHSLAETHSNQSSFGVS